LLFTDFLSFFGFDFDFEPFDYFDFEAFDYFDFDRETGLLLFPFDWDLIDLEDFVVWFFFVSLPLDLDALWAFLESFDLFLDEALLFTDFDLDLDFKSFDFDLDLESLDFGLPLLADFFAFPSSKICPSAMVCCMVLVPDNFFKSLALDSSLDFSILFIFDAFDYLDLLLDLEW
jgi:hypothetical protein